ncbi:MAG: hypothetical protein ABI589_04020 [Burkholderiales bacterium]
MRSIDFIMPSFRLNLFVGKGRHGHPVFETGTLRGDVPGRAIDCVAVDRVRAVVFTVGDSEGGRLMVLVDAAVERVSMPKMAFVARQLVICCYKHNSNAVRIAFVPNQFAERRGRARCERGDSFECYANCCIQLA